MATYEVITRELVALRDKHGVPRRTKLEPAEGEFTAEDFIENGRSVIVVTRSGYVKVPRVWSRCKS